MATNFELQGREELPMFQSGGFVKEAECYERRVH
jgi:hypothetical protein